MTQNNQKIINWLCLVFSLFFSNTMIKAVTPMIAKSEGAGERDKMLQASLLSAKYSFLLLAEQLSLSVGMCRIDGSYAYPSWW